MCLPFCPPRAKKGSKLTDTANVNPDNPNIKQIRPGFLEMLDFRRALTEETDRGCALLAASFLEGMIEELLRERLVDNPKLQKEMLHHSGPLGTFSSQIDMACLLGLVGPAMRRELHLIRQIRNDFGHTARRISFGEPSIASRCREMRFTCLDNDAEPRHLFTNAVFGVAAVIAVARVRTTHFGEALDKVPDEKTKKEHSEFAAQFFRDVFGEAAYDELQKLQRETP